MQNALPPSAPNSPTPTITYSETAYSPTITEHNPFFGLELFGIISVVVICALFFISNKKGWNDIIVKIAAILYMILLVWGGVVEWGKAGGWELAAIGILLILGILTFCYIFIIGLFGWKNFKSIELGFIVGVLANCFFGFAVADHSSLNVAISNIFGSALNFLSIPLLLLYLIRILFEYRYAKQNSSSTKPLSLRLFTLALLVVIIYSDNRYFPSLAKNDRCLAEKQERLQTEQRFGLIVPLSPNCR